MQKKELDQVDKKILNILMLEDLEQFVGELQEFGKAKAHVVFSTPVEHRGIQLNV